MVEGKVGLNAHTQQNAHTRDCAKYRERSVNTEIPKHKITADDLYVLADDFDENAYTKYQPSTHAAQRQ